MLSFTDRMNAKKELQENYKRLEMDERSILHELRISSYEFHAVLNMKNEDPILAWVVRDYLEEKLTEQGKEVFPFTTFDESNERSWYESNISFEKEII